MDDKVEMCDATRSEAMRCNAMRSLLRQSPWYQVVAEAPGQQASRGLLVVFLSCSPVRALLTWTVARVALGRQAKQLPCSPAATCKVVWIGGGPCFFDLTPAPAPAPVSTLAPPCQIAPDST